MINNLDVVVGVGVVGFAVVAGMDGVEEELKRSQTNAKERRLCVCASQRRLGLAGRKGRRPANVKLASRVVSLVFTGRDSQARGD